MELYHTFYEEYQPREGTCPSCVDQNMRNQLVIFEVLGQLNPSRESEDENGDQKRHSHLGSLPFIEGRPGIVEERA